MSSIGLHLYATTGVTAYVVYDGVTRESESFVVRANARVSRNVTSHATEAG